MLSDVLWFIAFFGFFFVLFYIAGVIFSVLRFLNKQKKGEAFCDNHPEVPAVGLRNDIGKGWERWWLCEPCIEARDKEKEDA